MGQYQESGRDRGHANLGVTLMGVIAKQAWNQGDDLGASASPTLELGLVREFAHSTVAAWI